MHNSRTYLAYFMLFIYTLSIMRYSYESIHLISHLPDMFKKEFNLHSIQNHQSENHDHVFTSFLSDENHSDHSIISSEYNPKQLEHKIPGRNHTTNKLYLKIPINTDIQLNYQDQNILPPSQPPQLPPFP